MTHKELLLGTAIVAMIAGSASVVLAGGSAGDDSEQAEADARSIRAAAEQWQTDNADQSGCPTISQLVHERALDRDAPTSDPWGERFVVSCEDGAVTVSSPGRDGKRGTKDDITSRPAG